MTPESRDKLHFSEQPTAVASHWYQTLKVDKLSDSSTVETVHQSEGCTPVVVVGSEFCANPQILEAEILVIRVPIVTLLKIKMNLNGQILHQ